MKLVFALFDSLNRLSLESYGSQSIKTPNFKRLSERCVTFDKHFVGSLPCMPARRDMQTGRLNFLHRSWGPLEPFDNSFPEILHKADIYSHLVSDHYHYWEDGGLTYHNRYTTYEFIRGQERDPWKAMVEPPWDRLKKMYHEKQYSEIPRSLYYHDIINREYIKKEEDFCSVKCFDEGLDFLKNNSKADNWFLQIETFDPHEPFYAPERFREDYPTNYKGPIRDWPPYERVSEGPDECDELKANYSAIVALCDAQIGRLLDHFDDNNLWDDTALIVSTDHGFLLGEHDWWAKIRMPCYNEVAHIPLFIHHPNYMSDAGTRRDHLTQTIDLMPTILDFFNLEPPREVEGNSIIPMITENKKIRNYGLYGVWGSSTNITDGRYTYFRYPDDMTEQEINQYTLMPTHITSFFTDEELKSAKLEKPFNFTKGIPLLKIKGSAKTPLYRKLGWDFFKDTETVLFDILNDPEQNIPIVNEKIENKLIDSMKNMMEINDAPKEAFTRLKI